MSRPRTVPFNAHGKGCTCCHRFLPHDEFGPNRKSKDGRQSWCRGCSNAYVRAYRRGPDPLKEMPALPGDGFGLRRVA